MNCLERSCLGFVTRVVTVTYQAGEFPVGIFVPVPQRPSGPVNPPMCTTQHTKIRIEQQQEFTCHNVTH